MGIVAVSASSRAALAIRFRSPRRPFLVGDAGGLGEGKGTSDSV